MEMARLPCTADTSWPLESYWNCVGNTPGGAIELTLPLSFRIDVAVRPAGVRAVKVRVAASYVSVSARPLTLIVRPSVVMLRGLLGSVNVAVRLSVTESDLPPGVLVVTEETGASMLNRGS